MFLAWYWSAAIFSGLVFFLVVPFIAALRVRDEWRRFRRAVVHAVAFPRIVPGRPRPMPADPRSELGSFRCLGRLQALQGENLVWLDCDGLAVGVDLRDAPMYLLPVTPAATQRYPDESPRVVFWQEVSVLAEGTQFFVAGTLSRRSDSYVFGSERAEHPLVIIFDGAASTVVERATWTGRQRNEYWNHLTPFSLLTGMLAAILVGVLAIGTSRVTALAAVTIGLVPILPVFPPGVIGYYFYRRMWRHARRARAIRDLIGLPAAVNAHGRSLGCGPVLRRVNTPEPAASPAMVVPPPPRSTGTWLVEAWEPTDPADALVPRLETYAADASSQARVSRYAWRVELTAIALLGVSIALNAYLAALAIAVLVM